MVKPLSPVLLKAGGLGFNSQADVDRLLSEVSDLVAGVEELVVVLQSRLPGVVHVPDR